MKLKLTPETLTVLRAIKDNGPILVPKLTRLVNLDRGKVEGCIATLEEKSLIKKADIRSIRHILTERGVNAAKFGLIEVKIVERLLESPVHMKDLQNLNNFSRSDISAGIGILKRDKMITINKGTVSLISKDKAKKYHQELQNALYELANGKDRIKDDIAIILKERGLIEIIEKSIFQVELIVDSSVVDKAQEVKEVTKLTPEMLIKGTWRDVNFKPYSMDVKPRKIYAGRLQPYRHFLDLLKIKLIGLGFQEMKGPIIEQEFWNFDALYAPQDHPAREDSDILLINEPEYGTVVDEPYVKNVARTHENGWTTGSRGHGYRWNPRKAARLLMRPQGTAISARTLSKINAPAKFFSIARCFRPDQIDATHAVEFDQTEGIICDPSITFRDLLGMLKTFAIEVAGATEVRFRPDYYPFTSPSVELSAKHPVLGYIEFGGAGIFRPEVTKPFGIDYPVLAWGLGVGRLFMTKYNIKDIRDLFSQDLNWLRNQKISSGIQVE